MPVFHEQPRIRTSSRSALHDPSLRLTSKSSVKSTKPPYGKRFFSCGNLSVGGRNGMASRGANNASRFGGRNCVITVVFQRRSNANLENQRRMVSCLRSVDLSVFLYFLFFAGRRVKKATAMNRDASSLCFTLSSSTHQQCDHGGLLFSCVDLAHVDSSNDEDHDGRESSSCARDLRELWCRQCSMSLESICHL